MAIKIQKPKNKAYKGITGPRYTPGVFPRSETQAYRDANEGKRIDKFYDPQRDGVTFSLLSTFLDCREKARFYLQGWTPTSSSMALTFGSIVHKIDEWVRDSIRTGKLKEVPSKQYIKNLIHDVEKLWHKDNPRAGKQELEHLELSLLLAEGVMPRYFKYWYKDFSDLQWEKVEGVFKVPYTVKDRKGNNRETFLRGKIDGSFRMKKGGPWLFETKTKSRIDEEILSDILPFEMQANIYLSALRRMDKKTPSGLLYNIIRRPGLRQRKNESIKAFADRIEEDVSERPDWYFVRMEMSIDGAEIDQFELGLEDLISDFLSWWSGDSGHYKNTNHCQNKFGLCPFIGICLRNDKTNYFKRKTVFRELQEW
jgi:hypothetical protein